MAFVENLEKCCEEFPIVGEKATYGTAGFRAKAGELKSVMLRCGMLSTLRSYMLGCKAVGCMVTASHNPASENGIKMIDPSGQMLGQNFELYANAMVNCPSPSSYIMKICRELSIDGDVTEQVFAYATVLIGRDTRESSVELANIVSQGVKAMGGRVIDLGVVTTPQLHFLVARANSGDREADEVQTEEAYFNIVAGHFMNFAQEADLSPSPETKLLIDGSNGVGALKFHNLEPVFSMLGLTHEMRNTGKEVMDVLNEQCGAEYVQKQKAFPRGFEGSELIEARGVSLDGDADRLVYFSASPSGQLRLFDGDKIAALFKRMIEDLLVKIVQAHPAKSEKVLHLGVVQTAYTNGAASAVMTTPSEGLALLECADISFDYAVVKTGVKHLHAKAETYQVGLYFETNGHGTVVVDFEQVDEWATAKGCQDSKEFKIFRAFLQIFNQRTGDAITNVLGVEACLKFLGMSMDSWAELYEEVPALYRTIPMPRRHLKQVLPSSADETQLIRPADMQKEITALIDAEKNQRAFVRSSGTEDVLRVYVESSTLEDASDLADKVEAICKKHFPSPM